VGREICEGNTNGLVDSLFAKSVLDVQADPVNVTWLVERGTCEHVSTHNILYLGGAEGTTILYDPSTHTVCRTPTGSLQITSQL
jgi:hypothetical protein